MDILALYFLAMNEDCDCISAAAAGSQIIEIRSFYGCSARVPLSVFPFGNGCLRCNVTRAAPRPHLSSFAFSSFFSLLSPASSSSNSSLFSILSVYTLYIYAYPPTFLPQSTKMATRTSPEAKPRFRLPNPRHGVDRPSPWPVRLLLSG